MHVIGTTVAETGWMKAEEGINECRQYDANALYCDRTCTDACWKALGHQDSPRGDPVTWKEIKECKVCT